MSKILLSASLVVLLCAAPAFAQDDSASSAKAAAPAIGASKNDAPSDIFLRNEESSITPSGDGFLRGGPINMQAGAYATPYGDDTAAKDAAGKVYNPDAELNAIGKPAPESDYSASAYNATQTKAISLTSTQEVDGGIPSPFPDWFGTYTPPKPKADTADDKKNKTR
jgi:hypothetical protein